MTIPLAARNIRPRADIIDQSLMPHEPCDLNFRHEGVIDEISRPLNGLRIWLGWAVVFTLLWMMPAWLLAAQMLAVAGTSVRFFIVSISLMMRLTAGLHWRMLLVIVQALLFLWLLIAIVREPQTQQLTIRLLMLAWIPAVILAADCLTTHVVWWVTANPRVPHRLMTLGRLLWNDRFLTRVVINNVARDEREARLLGQLRVGLGFVFRCLLLLSTSLLVLARIQVSNPDDAAWKLLLALTAVQFVMLLGIGVQHPEAVAYFRWKLWHWLFIDTPADAPPPVWRSPLGTSGQRRRMLWYPVLIVTLMLISLRVQHAGDLWAASWAQTGWCLLEVGLMFVASLGLVVLMLFNLTAPMLLSYRRLFGAPDSELLDANWSNLDGLADRLQHSTNPKERNCLYRGFHPDSGYPILVDTKLHFEHQLLLGGTGTRKTAIGLTGQVTQLIRRRDGAVIILDCKGDPALFRTACIEAGFANAKFKWFTNKPNKSTYLFNPVYQSQLTRLTMPQIVGNFMMFLNLVHGSNYGRGWYSASSRALFQEAMHEIYRNSPHKRPFSFREIESVLRRLAQDDSDFKDARHLGFIISNLSQFEQLNMSPLRDPGHPAMQNAIHMPDVIEQKQVIYFSLVGALDMSTVGEIARMAIYSANSAVMDYRERTGKRPRAHIIIDEAQLVMAQSLEVLLTQGRSHGLAFTFALQSLEQLNPPGGPDMRELVLNNTAIQQYFSARHPDTQRFISRISGESGYYRPTWKQLASDVVSGDVQIQRGVYRPLMEPEPVIEIMQEVGPRLSIEDISEISRNPNRCIMAIGSAEGYTSYRGAFPVHVNYSMTEQEYAKRENSVWPENSKETIEVANFWPDANAETVVSTAHPALPEPGQTITPDRLAELERRLNE